MKRVIAGARQATAVKKAASPPPVSVRRTKTVTIRELHNRTGAVVRLASRHGEIRVTDRGRIIARILPETDPESIPYFARRTPSAAFKRLDESGRTGRGTDSTVAISEDREDRV